MTPRTSAPAIVLATAAAVILAPTGSLLAEDGTAPDVASQGAPDGASVSLADVTEAVRASTSSTDEGATLQDIVSALGEGEGATILAGASFLWDPSVAPRTAAAGAVSSETETQVADAEPAHSEPAWSIERVISWAQSAVLFGDWLPSAELGSDSSFAVAERAPQEPKTGSPQAAVERADAESLVDRQAESQLAVARTSVTLTDVLIAARSESASLGDLSAVADLLRSFEPDPSLPAEPTVEASLETPAMAEPTLELAPAPKPTAVQPMRVTKVVPQARPALAPAPTPDPAPEPTLAPKVKPTLEPKATPTLEPKATPTLERVAAAPPAGVRYAGFTQALQQPPGQPGQVGLRLPKPVKRPFSAEDLGIAVTPGSSADSLANMLQRVGIDAAYVEQSMKAVAFNDVVDNAAGVRTVRGLYRIQRKREERARRSELVDALRDAVPSDGSKY